MELKDTIEGMQSSDYKERFIAEYNQLKIRYQKLLQFNTKIEAAKDCNNPAIEPKHDCPYELLREQQRLMGMLLNVLEKRAYIENIDVFNQ